MRKRRREIETEREMGGGGMRCLDGYKKTKEKRKRSSENGREKIKSEKERQRGIVNERIGK